MYLVKTRLGETIAKFNSYTSASEFKFCNGRDDWRIVNTNTNRPSTPKQKDAVKFCLMVLDSCDHHPKVNINSFEDCSNFLNRYLEDCKQFMRELQGEGDFL